MDTLAFGVHHMLDSRISADDQEGKTVDDKGTSRENMVPSAVFEKLEVHCRRANETNETQEETSDKVGEVGEVRNEPANDA